MRLQSCMHACSISPEPRISASEPECVYGFSTKLSLMCNLVCNCLNCWTVYKNYSYRLLQRCQRLQIVLNAAARHVVGTGEFSHVTPILRDVFHWLPVQHRISYTLYWSMLLLSGHPLTFISSIISNLSKNLSLNVCHSVNHSPMLSA